MKIRVALLLIALLLLTCGVARAAGQGPGYIYPSASTSSNRPVCNPLCTQSTVTLVIPNISYSGSGTQEGFLIWLGITGEATTNCAQIINTGNCLGQFGVDILVTTGNVFSCQAWYELWPTQTIQRLSTGTFPCAKGDILILSMNCSSNCTSYNPAQTWTVSLQDVTQGWTWNNGGVDFTWPLGNTRVFVVFENNGASQIPAMTPSLVGPWLINNAQPVLSAGSMISKLSTTSPSRFATSSGPFGSATGRGSYYNVCVSAVSAADAAKCGSATYSGAVTSVGP